MARFIIADLTDAIEVRKELDNIIPEVRSVPVKPIILAPADVFVTFEDYKDCSWVLELFPYQDLSHAIASLPEMVLKPAEAKVVELRK